MFVLAPAVIVVTTLLSFSVVAFAPGLVVADLNIGLLFFLGMSSMGVYSVTLAGWSSNNKYALLGSMRAAAQMLSYEVFMGLSLVGVIMLAESFNLGRIVEAQKGLWFCVPQLPGMVVFIIAGLAETRRLPFDLPEAESELVAGYHTEYSGLRFSFFFMSEYAAMYVICALATVLFLGGWHGPIPRPALPEGTSLITMWGEAIRAGIPGAQSFIGKFVLFFSSLIRTVLTPDGLRIIANEVIGAVNLLGKAFGLYFIMIWVRWTLPRIRIDQVMYLCLKVLLPIGLVCVIWAVVQVAVFP